MVRVKINIVANSEGVGGRGGADGDVMNSQRHETGEQSRKMKRKIEISITHVHTHAHLAGTRALSRTRLPQGGCPRKQQTHR